MSERSRAMLWIPLGILTAVMLLAAWVIGSSTPTSAASEAAVSPGCLAEWRASAERTRGAILMSSALALAADAPPTTPWHATSLVAPPAAPTDGRVIVRGVVVSAGAPVADALVTFAPSLGPMTRRGWLGASWTWKRVLPAVRTDRDGRFRLRLDPSLLGRSDEPRDPCRRFPHLVIRAPGFALEVRRCLPPREGLVDLGKVRLQPAPRVVGVILDCQGRPAAGTTVRVEQGRRVRHGEVPCSDPFGDMLEGTSDEQGCFEVVTRGPGEAVVRMRHPTLGRRPGETHTVGTRDVDLGVLRLWCDGEPSVSARPDVAADGPLRVTADSRVRMGGQLFVRVDDRRVPAPVDEVLLLVAEDGSARARCQVLFGRFDFPPVRPGRYRVEREADGGVLRTVDLRAGDDVDLELEVVP